MLAVFSFTIVYGAFAANTFYGAMNSVPQSQIETGKKNPSSPVMVDQICAILGLIWDDAEAMKELAKSSKSRVLIDTSALGIEATRAANLMAKVIPLVDEDEAKIMAEWLETRLHQDD